MTFRNVSLRVEEWPRTVLIALGFSTPNGKLIGQNHHMLGSGPKALFFYALGLSQQSVGAQ